MKEFSGKYAYSALVGANAVYACESIFIKLASLQEPLSFRYFLFVACALAVLALYAFIWQQILKRVPVSEAYMFKGTSLIFVLLISAFVFGEAITWTNVVGAAMIVGGIVMFART